MKKLRLLIGLIAMLMVGYSVASLNVYTFDDPAKEAEFKNLINELRCPKCQNNNLADSNAPLSTDIKNYVYQSVQNGTDKGEIVDFLASKYGDFITFKPRFAGRALWVWGLPIAVFLVALAVIGSRFVKRKKVATNTDLPSMETLIKDYEQGQAQSPTNGNNSEDKA